MFFVATIILIIIFIVCLLLKKKEKINLKKIICILLICIMFFVGINIFHRRHDIIFFFQSLEFENIDDYDYSKDIVTNGYISKEGAIKIAKEKTNKNRIAKVTCELVENGTYINYEESFKNILNKEYKDSQKQATYWMITLVTGWDYLCGHEEAWYFKVDYYSGEILQWDVTK